MPGDDADSGAESPRCDFCRLPLPDGAAAANQAVTRDHGGVTYLFCSTACAEALTEEERVFAQYHGSRYVRTGVAAIDASLPQGLPRNSFVLLSGQSGTRDEAVTAELVWRALERGEPAIVCSFLDSPTSMLQTFVDLDWNVLPYLEAGQLHLLDCFTYRLDDPTRSVGHMNDWNRHLHEVAADATTTVADPTNVSGVLSRLDSCLDAHGMDDEGIVVIDSLTELGSLVQPVKAYDFVKNVRAEVSKGRFVPVFASATLSLEEATFPHDLSYMVDCLVDLRLDDQTVPGTLLKQLRVRKATGALAISRWHTYEFTGGQGMVVFDPEEEIEKSRRRRGESDDAEQPPGGTRKDGAGDAGPPSDSEAAPDADPAGTVAGDDSDRNGTE